MNIKCFLVEQTGEYTSFVNGISSPIYKRTDTGEALSKLPSGAMLFVSQETHPKYRTGPDGKSLVVITPGGWWYVDERASNCGKPEDDEHRCWVRHGEAPNITVDKIGNTCSAGAGSIMIGGYHGFLRNGELTDC